MAASYPTVTKSFSTKAPADTIQAAHVNDIQDEIAAVETALLTGIAHALILAAADAAGGAGPRIHNGFSALRFVGGTGGFSWIDQSYATQIMTLSDAGELMVTGPSIFGTGITSYGLHNTGPLAEGGVVTVAQITADMNNYAPSGYTGARVLRLASDASRTITGIAASPAQALWLVNGGVQNIVLAYESASSTAANRFVCPGLADFTLHQGDAVQIWYDDASARWRVLAY